MMCEYCEMIDCVCPAQDDYNIAHDTKVIVSIIGDDNYDIDALNIELIRYYVNKKILPSWETAKSYWRHDNYTTLLKQLEHQGVITINKEHRYITVV